MNWIIVLTCVLVVGYVTAQRLTDFDLLGSAGYPSTRSRVRPRIRPRARVVQPLDFPEVPVRASGVRCRDGRVSYQECYRYCPRSDEYCYRGYCCSMALVSSRGCLDGRCGRNRFRGSISPVSRIRW